MLDINKLKGDKDIVMEAINVLVKYPERKICVITNGSYVEVSNVAGMIREGLLTRGQKVVNVSAESYMRSGSIHEHDSYVIIKDDLCHLSNGGIAGLNDKDMYYSIDLDSCYRR